jgi:hypothetical protein
MLILSDIAQFDLQEAETFIPYMVNSLEKAAANGPFTLSASPWAYFSLGIRQSA